MDRFDALQLFVRIVELGSFTRAAGALGIPRATATMAIKELEARLDARLLERTTRTVRPTLDGEAFYQRCLHLLADLEEAESSLRQGMVNPRGTLRLGIHGTHATRIVLPHIGDFHRAYPRISVVVHSGDRLVDLVAEGIDCVIRGGVPKDSSLIARRLAVIPEVICASPQYLARAGTPQHPDELARHEAVGFFSSNHDSSYPFELMVDGALRRYEPDGWLAVNDAENYVAAAIRGCGLIQLPRFHVEDELGDGRLIEVLADWRSPGMPVSALYPQHRQVPSRVRVFVDWVAGLYADRFGTPDERAAAPLVR